MWLLGYLRSDLSRQFDGGGIRFIAGHAQHGDLHCVGPAARGELHPLFGVPL
jgi:hypothetical protein